MHQSRRIQDTLEYNNTLTHTHTHTRTHAVLADDRQVVERHRDHIKFAMKDMPKRTRFDERPEDLPLRNAHEAGHEEGCIRLDGAGAFSPTGILV